VNPTFKDEYVDRGRCGDHYCDGHIDRYLACEDCSWKIKVGKYSEPQIDLRKLEHRLYHVESLLRGRTSYIQ
jgi:hypothetical protein